MNSGPTASLIVSETIRSNRPSAERDGRSLERCAGNIDRRHVNFRHLDLTGHDPFSTSSVIVSFANVSLHVNLRLALRSKYTIPFNMLEVHFIHFYMSIVHLMRRTCMPPLA
jgi:hypothetical protein